jgi:hypothetical protein
VEEIVPGLRRWTAWHDHWEENVGAVAAQTAQGLVLIDPLEPPPDLGKAEHVLVTVYWHGRGAADVGAKHIWASTRSARPLENRGIGVTDSFRAGDDLPGGIEAFQTARAAEVVYWLPAYHSVVVGDVLLGAGAKPRATDDELRLCPEGWLGKRTHAELKESLRPLLELSVDHVLVSHGRPVLHDGRRALAGVLS